MKKDIANRDDIYNLVSLFYDKLLIDIELKHFFEDFNDKILLEEHLKVLVEFWDNILFFSGGYRKNAMKPHLDLQQTKPFKPHHFKRWLSNFNESVNVLFEGDNAHAIKSRALSIATVMEIKISQMND
jgi:hemoglobin